MIGDKLICELFIAPGEDSLKVHGMSGHFITEHLISFLRSSEDSDIYIADVIKSIKEKFGKEDGMYTVTCELDYIEQEQQGDHILPGYYAIGRIINIREEEAPE